MTINGSRRSRADTVTALFSAVFSAVSVAVFIAVSIPAGAAARATTPGLVHGRLAAVSCPSDSFCMAVGLRYAGTNIETDSVLAGLAYRWSGSRWVAIATVAAAPGYRSIQLDDVSCTSSRFCTALGSMRTGAGVHGRQVLIAERWNGSYWRFLPIERPGSVYQVGLSCSGRRSCIAVGSRGGTGRTSVAWQLVRDAFVLRRTAHRPFPKSYLTDVSCYSPVNCTAVGYETVGGRPLAEKWNGHRWSWPGPLPYPGPGSYLYSVSCPGPRACVATGEGPGLAPPGEGGEWAFVENHPDGGPWHYAQPHLNLPYDSGGIQPLRAVSCDVFRRCAAVGSAFDRENPYPVTAWRDFHTHGFVIREPGYHNRDLPSYFPEDVACRAAGCVYVGADSYPYDDPSVPHDPVIFRGRATPTRQPIPPPPPL